MGYMTTVTLLNDGWSNIEADPKGFVEKVRLGMHGISEDNKWEKNINTYRLGNHSGIIDVLASHHADEARLLLIYQNAMTVIGYGNDSKSIEQRKRALVQAKQMIKWEEEQIKKLEQESLKR